MCHNRISAVHNLCIISSLVEHTHIYAENVCIVNRTVHSALIRGNHHHMILINIQISYVQKKSLDKLIGAGNIVKRISRNRIHDSRIMRIEGEEVLHAHLMKFLQHHRAVQGFSSGTLVLSGLVHKGHDDVDTLCFSRRSGNQAFQIRIVVIRRHVIHMTEDGIRDGIVHHIHQ